jgi:hypothetical protein
MAPRAVALDKIRFVPGEGLQIESADGDFALNLSFRLQVLYTALDEDPATKKTEESIQVRRARAQLYGNAFGKHNKYKFELAFSPTDVDTKDSVVRTSPLLEAYAEFDYLRDLTVRAGQTKVPYDRIRRTSDTSRQLVDYGATTAEFTLDRDIGVELRSADFLGLGCLRYVAGIFSGDGRNSFTPTDFGMLYVARVDFLPFGLFDDLSEADFARARPRLAIGAAYAHNDRAKRDRSTNGNPFADGGTANFDHAVVDTSFKAYGFSAIGAFYYRHANRSPGSATTDTGAPVPVTASRDGIGWIAQAGYLIPRTGFEVAARYEGIEGRTTKLHNGLKDQTELGGGLNYYFAEHALKLQADYFRVYASDGFTNGNNQVRLQLQMVL